MDRKILLAFDFGASSGRAMVGVYEGGKLTLEEVHRFSNDPVRTAGYFYWDTLRLFHEMKEGIRKARAKFGRFDAIGIDTWGVDYALIGSDGEILSTPIHYRDARTDTNRAEVESIVSYEEMYARTGIAYWPFNTIYQLHADRTRRPELFALARHILFTPDLFAYLLTGVMKNEYTIASTGQLIDAFRRDYDQETLDRLGIPAGLFPGLIQPGETFGMLSPWLCDELDVPSVPVIAVCTHDTASASTAVPVDPDRRCAFLSCGTWSLLGMEIDTPVIGAAARKADFTNEAGAFGRIILLKNINGLWLMQNLRKNWADRFEKISYDDIEKMAAEALENGATFRIDPNAPRFMNPLRMIDEISAYCEESGQGRPHGMGEHAAAVYNGLTHEYRTAIEGLEGILGERIDQLNMVGGGIQDRLLCRLTARSIGRPVVCGPIEGSVIGNVLIQLVGLGVLKGPAEAREVVHRSFPVDTLLP